MPTKHSKNTPLAGTGWLVGLRSMSADLTPSKSKGSEVGKHYSPTHQPPKVKTKTKTKVKNKGQGQGQGQGQNHHRYRSSKRRGSDQAAVQEQQKAREPDLPEPPRPGRDEPGRLRGAQHRGEPQGKPRGPGHPAGGVDPFAEHCEPVGLRPDRDVQRDPRPVRARRGDDVF